MTDVNKKLREDVKKLKRDVKRLNGLVAKSITQMERATVVAATASRSASETKKKLASLMRDPSMQVPQKLERKVEALNRAHANTHALVKSVEKDVGAIGDAVHKVNKDWRDDVLKSLRGFEERLDQMEGAESPLMTVADLAALNAAESSIKASGVDANGSPVEPEPVTIKLWWEQAVKLLEAEYPNARGVLATFSAHPHSRRCWERAVKTAIAKQACTCEDTAREPTQMTLDDALTVAGEATGIPGGAS